MAIYWEDKLSVGVEVIDTQHKKFIELLNELSEAITSMKTSETIEKILDGLDQYAVYHFETEEKYFKEFHFEGAEEHIREHRNFVEKLGEIKKGYNTDRLKMSIKLVEFMTDWLINHLEMMDRKYVECFSQHGLR
ncbi:MAG TPA: bacteriohemerythrin [Candidatus Woesebacteria bacterium]|nr:bacteriohemerythrin [Candidatus Woesebacteria bacterium]